jgi:hypothetical protein
LGRLQPDTPDTRVDPSGETPMVDILERIARRYADRTDVVVHFDPRLLEQLDEEYAELRETLTRLLPGTRAESAPMPTAPAEEEPTPPEAPPLTVDVPDDLATRPAQPVAEEDFVPWLGGEIFHPHLERLFDALRHGERVDQLGGGGNTRFDELMAQGEKSLRAGEFFDAERRFMRALRILPGHPLAMVGAAHSQIGAGLQIPAALSIRRVLTGHPELIASRYGEDLIPARARLVEVVHSIERRVSGGVREVGEYGLLLGYLGYHLDDRQLIQRGLRMMAEGAPDDPLVQVLARIWLESPAADNEHGESPAGEDEAPARAEPEK